MSNIDEKLASIPTSPLLAERMTKEQPSCENDPKIVGCSDDTISRQAVIDLLKQMRKDGDMVPWEGKNVFARIRKLPPAQPDVPDIYAGELISRQAAIDVLDVLCQEHRYKIPGKAETYSQYNEAWQDALDRAEGAIFNLPPVQPFYNITMNDVLKYIDDMPEDVWQEFTACLECRGWELQRRTAKWCGSEFA